MPSVFFGVVDLQAGNFGDVAGDGVVELPFAFFDSSDWAGDVFFVDEALHGGVEAGARIARATTGEGRTEDVIDQPSYSLRDVGGGVDLRSIAIQGGFDVPLRIWTVARNSC